jgi:spore maturation protein CgeB
LQRFARARLLGSMSPAQIKGRTFEAPGCGGFLLTGPADNLEDYYTSGREITTYRTFGELIDTIRYYLDHEHERAKIAGAGYRRTLAEHTYLHRFRQIFQTMGLECSVSDNKVEPAQVIDIAA